MPDLVTDTQLYIAGPMSRIPQFNFPSFLDAALLLRENNYWVISPHEQDSPEVQAVAWASETGDPAELADLAALGHIGATPLVTARSNLDDVAQCDGIALLPGWENSLGTKFEIAAANRFGIPVKPLEEWLPASEDLDDILDPNTTPIDDGGLTLTEILAMDEDEYSDHCEALWDEANDGITITSQDDIERSLDEWSEWTDTDFNRWLDCGPSERLSVADVQVSAEEVMAMDDDEFKEYCQNLFTAASLDQDSIDRIMAQVGASVDRFVAQETGGFNSHDELWTAPPRVGTMADVVDGIETISEPIAKLFREQDERRTVSPTGGEKGAKLACFSQIPAGPLLELAEHYGRGAEKYDAHNFRKGYNWSLSIDALNRHLWAFVQGEDIDPETGSKHITAVAWHALALSSFMDEHPEYDDRYQA